MWLDEFLINEIKIFFKGCLFNISIYEHNSCLFLCIIINHSQWNVKHFIHIRFHLLQIFLNIKDKCLVTILIVHFIVIFIQFIHQSFLLSFTFIDPLFKSIDYQFLVLLPPIYYTNIKKWAFRECCFLFLILKFL